MLELREFTSNIMTLKLQAVISNNPIKNLLDVLSLVQAHAFYADKDIVSSVSACQDRDYLNGYIVDRLIELNRQN